MSPGEWILRWARLETLLNSYTCANLPVTEEIRSDKMQSEISMSTLFLLIAGVMLLLNTNLDLLHSNIDMSKASDDRL